MKAILIVTENNIEPYDIQKKSEQNSDDCNLFQVVYFRMTS